MLLLGCSKTVDSVDRCVAESIISKECIDVATSAMGVRWCQSQARLDGKTAIVTGSNSGIGREAAAELARRGAHVILACRNVLLAESERQKIVAETGNSDVCVERLDLASFSSIKDFVREVLKKEDQVHILINNAGIAFSSTRLSPEGLEMILTVNHFGPFLLTLLLLDILKRSAPSRIITVSSTVHRYGSIDFDDINLEHGYTSFKAYARSKLANILFTRELARRLYDSDVTVYCLHPGLVKTNIFDDANIFLRACLYPITRLFFVSPTKGAQTIIHCAVEDDLKHETGQYYVNCRRSHPSWEALDDTMAARLWRLSEDVTGFSLTHTRPLDLNTFIN